MGVTREQLKAAYEICLRKNERAACQSAPLDPLRIGEDIRVEIIVETLREGLLLPDAIKCANQFEPKSFHSMKSILDDQTSRIEAAIGRMGVKLDYLVYVGEFPGGDYTARIECVPPDGAIIMVHTELMFAIHQMVKLYLMAWNFAHEWPGGRIDRLMARPAIASEVLAKAIATVGRMYCEGNVRQAPRFPALVGYRGWLLGIIVDAAERFVIAHEYGHILNGHLDSAPDIDFLEERHQREFAADDTALSILLAVLNWSGSQGAVRDYVKGIATGVVLFFWVAAVVERIGQIVRGWHAFIGQEDQPLAVAPEQPI